MTRLQEFARRSGTRVHYRPPTTTTRESRPRFSGVGCDVPKLVPACHAVRHDQLVAISLQMLCHDI